MQLDLLEWRAPQIEVIPFPTKRRVGHIRQTAHRIYNSRTTREADNYWRRAADGLCRQMDKAGVHPSRIEIEVSGFHDSVQVEIARLARGAIRPNGGAGGTAA